MKNWIIRILKLKGSWGWACKQMELGYIVRPSSASGSIKYKLDHEGQRRIIYTFSRNPTMVSDWQNANIFLDDFETTDWKRWGKPGAGLILSITPPTKQGV